MNKRIIRLSNIAIFGMLIIMLIFYIFQTIPVQPTIYTGIGGIEDTAAYIDFTEIHMPVKQGDSGMNITYLHEFTAENFLDKLRAAVLYRDYEPTTVDEALKGAPDFDETDNINYGKWTTEHQNETLTAIAIKYAHLPIEVKSSPTIAFTYDKFNTGKVFRKNDVITEYNDQPVSSVDEIMAIKNTLKIEKGTKLNYKVIRDGKTLSIPITYTEKAADGSYFSGIVIYDKKHFSGINPNKLFLFGEGFSGDSAGLMMTLGLIEKLNSVEDLTKGYLIAGTGTVDEAENVGEIGEVKLKVKTAEKNQVDYFFVPKSHNKEERNEKDANDAAAAIKAHVKIVAVSTVGEALEFLKKLPNKK